MSLKRVFAASSGSGNNRISTPLKYTGSIKLSNGENYTPKPGSLVTVTRAISARVNQNFDGFPSAELKKAHKTFIGRPVFVNHNNEDQTRTRGIVIDSVYKEADKDKYIELTIEVDAKTFPRIAALISTGELDSVSMGTDVKFTKCSYCDNKAYDVDDFCDHVKYQKGQRLSKLNPETGKQEKVLVYESCHGLNFFEISYVFDPADETAINQKVYLPKMSANFNKQALGELTSPTTVDTLTDHDPCPQCGDDDFDGKECKWCEYNTPPKEFQDPDTMKSRVLQMVRNDPNAKQNSDPIENNVDIVRHNAGKEGSRMGATRLQMIIAQKRREAALARLADVDSTVEEARKVDHDTDVTNIDSNPVTFDDARKPDDTADVTKLEPSAGVPGSKSSKKTADFPDPSQPPAAGAPGPGASAPDAGPSSDDGSDASNSIDNLPIDWKQDESGQPYGTVQGTNLDIFVNEDMSWQVLPEGSDQPIDQGQGSSYEDCVQQAFQSAQSGGSAAPADPSADPSAAPADPAGAAPAGPPADPTKVSSMKTAEGVPAASKSAEPDERTDVTKLPEYETIDDGGHTFKKDQFGHNAGDGLGKVDDSTSPEMAPGGGSFKDNNKKARVSSTKAAELVDAYIEHGIVANNRTAKYAAIGEVSKLSREIVEDRLVLLAQIEKGQQRLASRPRNSVPRLAAKVPNMTRSASSSSSDDDTSSILFGV